MILRPLDPPPAQSAEPQTAWPAFQKTQEGVALPCFAIPQFVHANLAGDLACCLRPEFFGPLPPEILEAIRVHDIGWREADEGQLARLREASPDSEGARPLSFTEIPAAEPVPAWRRSIRHAETISVAAGIIVSRHFCSLATDGEEHHRAFLEEETRRRESAEKSYPEPEELGQWLGALGFCDLFSLVLCSGLEQAVTMPLAHPNMPEAKKARSVSIQARGGELRTQPSVLEAGCSFALETPLQGRPGEAAQAQSAQWRVVG